MTMLPAAGGSRLRAPAALTAPADEAGYDIAGDRVVLDANRRVHDYVGRFFPRAAGAGPAAGGLAIEARCGGTAVRIAYRPPGGRRRSMLVPVAEEGVAVRKLIRAWYLTRPGAGRPGLLHAAAFLMRGRLVVLLGPPLAGKTTLLLDAVLTHRFDGLANDALAVGHDGRRVANVPSVVGVRAETLRTFAAPLRPLFRHEAPTADPVADGPRYFYPGCLLSTVASWHSIARPVARELAPVIAVARFAGSTEPVRITPVTPARVRRLAVAELTGWRLGGQVDALAADLGGVAWTSVVARSVAALDRLMAGASLVELVHRGRIAPLLHSAAIREGAWV
jgi:hypothetical protein